MAGSFVELDRVLAFVERTTSYGVPLRVALRRAAKRFDVDKGLLRDFYRAQAG